MVEKLDDLPGYSAWDRSDMLSQLDNFVMHVKEAINYKSPSFFGISNICLCGIGGSAMCGDIIVDYLTPICNKNISVIRNVSLTKWANSGTLVVVISYSGNTKEALDIFEDSLSKGMKAICVFSGGELIKRARERNIPFILVPAGIPPRAALGYLLGSVAVVLDSAGVGGPVSAIAEVIPFARSCQEKLAPSVPISNNAAKKIAIALKDSIPSIYCPRSIRSIGVRWQNQINENAKMVAFTGEIPEMNHNQMVAWMDGKSVSNCKPVFIIPEELEPTMKKMTMVTVQMFNERGLDPVLVQLEGRSTLENLFHGLILGDMVSYYLARLREIDPTPVDVIVEFKKRIGN